MIHILLVTISWAALINIGNIVRSETGICSVEWVKIYDASHFRINY